MAMDLRLYKAATSGRVSLFKDFANENPSLVEGETPLKNTVLHLAAKLGHEDLVKEVYEKENSLLDKKNSKGDTALHIAARAGYLSIVKFLVEKSTSLDAEQGGNPIINILMIQNEGNNTVLHEALRYRHSKVAKVLTEKCPELWGVLNEAGESPLYLAAKGGLTKIACGVLNSSEPYVHEGPNRLTALHAAVISGDYGITKLLVEKKPQLIIEKDLYGRTALHYAASYRKYRLAKLLLKSDSSVAYIQDNDGRSALHFAAGNGNTRTTKEIIQSYPDVVDLVDNRGQNAIHVCICNYNKDMQGFNQEVLTWFMSKVWHNDILNQPDIDGNTPLHLAAYNPSPVMVSSMLKNRGTLDTAAMNKDNLTPLDLALSGKFPIPEEEYEVFKHLLSADAKFGIAKPLHGRILFLNEEFISTKQMNSTQMVVATLIATVTFAAAFQVPEIYKSDGSLVREVIYKAFVVSDATAFSCSMTAVFLNFIIPLIRFYLSETYSFFTAFLTLIAIVAMLIAFMTGLYVVLTNS
ncbi:hypothetical protein HHK36_022361 [Tetracentron sinense]|uniref:PGG domain-containing protein n=1 Tax=Tetracentron sinense TaxID=13715 RepID=A0A835D8R5_TETSI|nr:hypothetical protein HHK36_022352 [Tetracentron sinense]KAF8392021.1 hypothetical protein HHK36_022361 [Tetracentron sinense]